MKNPSRAKRRSASAVNSRPWQLASLVLIEPLTHVRGGVPPLSIRGGCTPVNSRRVAARDNSRLGAVSYAHACANHQRTSAAQCLGCQFAPWDGG